MADLSIVDPRRALGVPWIYEGFQRAIGKDRLRRRFVERYVRPTPGQTILDIGCGPGDLLRFLPSVNYVGFDVSEDYVASARSRFPDARFVAGTLDDLQSVVTDPVDLAVTVGVIHHVDDDEAERILTFARQVLAPGGRFVSLEPHFHDGQHPVSLRLIKADRGEHVRRKEDYVRLCSQVFEHVAVHEDDVMLRVPYSIVVLDCAP